MFRRIWVGGVLCLAGLAATAELQPASAQTEDRMALGAMPSLGAEFQAAAGDRVFFSDTSAELGSRGRVALESQAAWLARHPHLSVIVEGHADDAGSDAHNLDISRKRAEAVRLRLVQMGISPHRISTVAFGRARLVAECSAPACTAQNRRVVTVVGAPLDRAARGIGALPRVRGDSVRSAPAN